jgi:ligand-binding sensor domain-containing protein
MGYKIIFLFFFIHSFASFPQQITNWKNFTDMKNVKDVSFSDESIWAVTDGGAFNYSLSNNSFQALTKADGLKGLSLTSLTLDSSGRIWFGSADGVIDIYTTEKESFDVILDIANSNQVNKRINYLNQISDTIIVCSDFGVSLINANNFLFFDTFFKFGEFTTNTKVNYADKYELFYVGTDEGVAIQKPGTTNLSAPESWNTYSSINGLPSDKVFKIVSFRDTIIASTDNGFAIFNGSSWLPFLSQFNNKSISDFVATSDSLIILSEDIIYLYKNGNVTELFTSPYPTERISISNQFGIAGATLNGALYLTTSNSPSFNYPNGPSANQFPSMSVDGNGKLWSASGKDNTGVGFYTYDKVVWTNFDTDNTPNLPHNDVYYAYTSSDNTAYLGTWGFGFVRTDGVNFELFNSENSGMQGIPENPNFLVITGFGTDSRGNTWILNLAAADRKTLSMLTPDSTWYHFFIPSAQNRILRQQLNLAVDAFDTKWYNSEDGSRRGLFYFNEMKTYDDAIDDKSGFLTSDDGLTSSEINSVVVDKRGDVWVGTTLGVTVISNTNSILTSTIPSLRISSIFSLRQQSINDIAVDPLNQKWIATNQGLLLVNSDGSRLLATYDSKNSPILSDKIISLAVDENAGIIYVGTDKGLTSFNTPFIKPNEAFDKLFIFPNPFIIVDDSKLLTIDGLISNSDIKVLTIDGKLVTEFSSPGGRTALWDGRDDNGNLVNSGIYLIVAFDKEGNNVVTGKVAVLRQ